MSEINIQDDKYAEFLNDIPADVRDEVIKLFCLYVEQIADIESGELPQKCECCGQFILRERENVG